MPWVLPGSFPAVFRKKPITLTDEWKAQQLQRILDMKGNPVQGLASRWDGSSRCPESQITVQLTWPLTRLHVSDSTFVFRKGNSLMH